MKDQEQRYKHYTYIYIDEKERLVYAQTAWQGIEMEQQWKCENSYRAIVALLELLANAEKNLEALGKGVLCTRES
jgi:hypothetical protein